MEEVIFYNVRWQNLCRTAFCLNNNSSGDRKTIYSNIPRSFSVENSKLLCILTALKNVERVFTIKYSTWKTSIFIHKRLPGISHMHNFVINNNRTEKKVTTWVQVKTGFFPKKKKLVRWASGFYAHYLRHTELTCLIWENKNEKTATNRQLMLMSMSDTVSVAYERLKNKDVKEFWRM